MDFESVIDILEFAVAREIEAYYLYTTLADQIDNAELREVFHEFAAEELSHKQLLEFELIKLGKTVDGSLPELQSPIQVEMDAGVDYKDVLVMAITKEGDAFKLYVDLAAMIQDPEFRNIAVQLAETEAKHKAKFELEYEKMLRS